MNIIVQVYARPVGFCYDNWWPEDGQVQEGMQGRMKWKELDGERVIAREKNSSSVATALATSAFLPAPKGSGI